MPSGEGPVEVLAPDSSTTGCIASLLAQAQAGEPQHVLDVTDKQLRAVTGDLADGPAGLHFARIIALRCLGRVPEAIEAVGLMLMAAVRDGDPGWRSCALSLRADMHMFIADSDASVYDADAVMKDLVDSEIALDEGVPDPMIACNAHAGAGNGYALLRLYELAVPHYEAALRLAEQVPDGAGNAFLWLGNLCLAHMLWGLELYRVGEPDEAEQHIQLAGRFAVDSARETGPSDGDHWVELASLYAACARADGPDPASSIADLTFGIEALRSRGQGWAVELAQPFLAVALKRTGNLPRALEVIRLAARDVTAASEWQMAAAVAHTHALLLVEVGSDDAAVSMRYGDALAKVLWRERLRNLHTARTLRDYERLRDQTETISRTSSVDALTGVLNRRGFDERLAELRQDFQQRDVAVLVIDLDRFKEINDTLGHQAGDAALQHVARVLQAAIRTGDAAARLGGDEFAALLIGARAASARRVAEQIVADVDAVPGAAATVSIGVALGSVGQVTEILALADDAMYCAKRAGGDRVALAAAPS